MNINVSLAGLRCLAFALSLAGLIRAEAQVKPLDQVQITDTVIDPPRADDTAWAQLATAVSAPRAATTSGPAVLAQVLDLASKAKDFYTKYPAHASAVEARKWEALLLIDAASSGDAKTVEQMKAVVQTFRSDSKVPAPQRVIVAGTYEFTDALQRIKSVADMLREYEASSRILIKEFPDQSSGYVALLTQANLENDKTARALAAEVANATTAPLEAKTRAQRLITRLDLIGQPVDPLLAALGVSKGNDGWVPGRPGMIYFWATGNPDSVRFAEQLATKKLTKLNVVGVSLDEDATVAAATTRDHKLAGQLASVAKGAAGAAALQLGADAAPLIYLVDASGQITDVRGLNDLDAKLTTLGL